MSIGKGEKEGKMKEGKGNDRRKGGDGRGVGGKEKERIKGTEERGE